jgi:hypothetical protein
VGPKNAPGREDLADVKSVQYQVDRGSKRRRRHPWDKQVEPPLGPASDRAMAEGRIYGSATGVLVRPELLTEINEDLYRNGKNGGVIQILYFSETERRRRRSKDFCFLMYAHLARLAAWPPCSTLAPKNGCM